MRLCLAALLFCSISSTAQVAAPTSQEARASRAFEAAKKAGVPELYAFLKLFPKGADLHMHLSGAIYAETFIAEAAQLGLWVGSADPGKPGGPLASGTLCFQNPPSSQPNKTCGAAVISVADAMQNQTTYDALIDSFSMRSFVPFAGWSGHDQFFATFDRFSGLNSFAGSWLDEVATRAATQNEQYLEIMATPTFDHAAAAGYKVGWPADFNDANHMAVLATLRDKLLAAGLRDDIAPDTKQIADAQATRRSIEHCDPVSDPVALKEHSACTIDIHILYQVLRGFPPQQVFAQTLLGFELASVNPDIVGINFVRAEDRRDAMAEYHTEMLMLDYLHSAYPKVHISLHAGELALGLVPPAGLSFHIREAIELGHAERIGHGVDVLYEDRPNELLKEMAAKHIDVEVNLTSNDGILGIKGTDHPLSAYRAAKVPFSLSTDDEGVSRGDLTHEYVRAAFEQSLSYTNLKQSARSSLEHSFIPGESLDVTPDDFVRRKPACAAAITATSKPTAACQKLLDSSERATQQYELERRFAAFEAGPL
jgi:adenosine deaminase